MCCIMGNGVLQGTSVVIGICGTNFCTFWADGRKIVDDDSADGGFRIEGDDHFQKIFKLNSRVLFGAAGWFSANSDLTDAVKEIPDIEHASVRMVRNAVVNYIRHLPMRHRVLASGYLVGGKHHDGTFSIYEISWNQEKDRVQIIERRPAPPATNYGISLMLPFGEPELVQKVVAATGSQLSKSRDHSDLIHKINEVVYTISTIDESVGPEAMSLSVF